jgi:beta-carotene ketolase (CrtW type)
VNSYPISLPRAVEDYTFRQLGSRLENTLGLGVAIIIISLWSVSLLSLLSLDIDNTPVFLLPIVILVQAFLYTGLFITAHDAMHGAVYPANKKINHSIGAIACFLYCFFPYKQLLKNHGLHHHHPASEHDPDYHDGEKSHPIAWYLHFMKNYWTWYQFNGMTILFWLLICIFHVSPVNFFLFLALPLVLSSLQLFYFGTYLPHREPKNGYQTLTRARTIDLPVFWSFLACYHFGYHREHHDYPRVPWWRLPEVHGDMKKTRG